LREITGRVVVVARGHIRLQKSSYISTSRAVWKVAAV